MCGIIGYVGNRPNGVDVLIDGLKCLEYRGYDSAGIAFIQNNGIKIVKAKGKIKNLEEKLSGIDTNNCSVGIGHTRWATHGVPNDINAHPHQVGKVTMIHNGIIENYELLKKELLEKGYNFISETDTEIACAAIDDILKTEKSKIKVMIETSNKIRGSYALGIIFDDEKDVIYAMRKDSPLIVALGENENFIASDVPAILKYTNKYLLLEKDEYAKISKDKVIVYDKKGKEIKKKIETATWTIEEASKGGYEHYMLKEIYEQPRVVSNIISKYLDNGYQDIVDNMIDFSKYDNIHIVGCGSAMYAGIIGKHLIEKYANVRVMTEIASEYRYRNITFDKKTLVIIISQSGETADSLAALKLAKENNIDTLAIVNVVGSSIAREAKHVMYMYVGPEIAVATTKALSTQVAMLSLIALNLYITRNNKLNINLNKICNEIKNVSKYLEEVLANRDQYLDIAKMIYQKDHVFFIGRGIDYALCMEGSLKLKEISYIHSEAYAAGELKHGTISLIEPGTPVIAIATEKNLIEKTVSNIKETHAREANVIFITTKELDIDSNFYNKKIVLPTTNDFISPLVTIIPLQLIAYEVAKMRELDIDKPRNLAKSVTVE
jgi:glucosamine--fructose-6-phosphate aminotransferase (isomerizing)